MVRVYRAPQQADALATFQADATTLADHGYRPVSQSWAQGQWGWGAWLFALVLWILLIGILVFIYMLIVKPYGTLTVTYEYRAPVRNAVTPAVGPVAPVALPADDTTSCPRCAETIKKAAKMCRFCNLDLTPGPVG